MDKQERERAQHRLAGCMDPNCPMCNPETAARGGERTSPFFISSDSWREAGARQPSPDEIWRMTKERIKEEMRSQPSSRLSKLREPIEKWITSTNPNVALDEVIGNADARRAIESALLDQLDNQSLYAHYNLRAPKGVMLWGPPGCGKTMFAKAAATLLATRFDTQVEMVNISAQAIQTPFVGETESIIRAIFAYARVYREERGHPLLIFIDEADVLLPDRTGKLRRVALWEESNVATFLTEMDGLEKCGAFVMLATNRPEAIDEALLRDGRCDRKIKVERPTPEAFHTIMERQLKTAPTSDPHNDLLQILVDGFYHPFKVIQSFTFEGKPIHFTLGHIASGAIANSLVNRAKQFAFERDRKANTITGIMKEDCVAAVEQIWEENRELSHSFALKEFIVATGIQLEKMEAEMKRSIN